MSIDRLPYSVSDLALSSACQWPLNQVQSQLLPGWLEASKAMRLVSRTSKRNMALKYFAGHFVGHPFFSIDRFGAKIWQSAQHTCS